MKKLVIAAKLFIGLIIVAVLIGATWLTVGLVVLLREPWEYDTEFTIHVWPQYYYWQGEGVKKPFRPVLSIKVCDIKHTPGYKPKNKNWITGFQFFCFFFHRDTYSPFDEWRKKK